jgi:hypothetical protein
MWLIYGWVRLGVSGGDGGGEVQMKKTAVIIQMMTNATQIPIATWRTSIVLVAIKIGFGRVL